MTAFRAQLGDAVKQRDAAKLKELVDPHIRTSFGDGGGADEFAKQLSKPDSPTWTELEQVLSLGGSFLEGSQSTAFWAPYVYSKWPDSIDSFGHVAAIRADVVLRAEPNENAAEIARVDWEILEIVRNETPDANPGWMFVKSPNGKEAWVRKSDVRSPIDHRAGFNKVDGRWRMTGFVAGD